MSNERFLSAVVLEDAPRSGTAVVWGSYLATLSVDESCAVPSARAGCQPKI
jgi:hypothetical protein